MFQNILGKIIGNNNDCHVENINIADCVPLFKKHPYLVLGVLCLLFSFGFNQDVIPFMDWWLVLTLGAICIFWVGIYFKRTVEDFVFSPRGGLALLPFGIAVLVSGAAFKSGKWGIAGGGITVLIFIIIAALVLKFTKRLSVENGLFLIFATGLLVRVVYALYTPIALESVRQHDVFPFMKWEGDVLTEVFENKRHAEYIEYIARYLRLPSENPNDGLSQLYHPPLHHIIAGLWLRLQKELGVNYQQAVENIQMLTVFYSSSCMITGYKIFKEVGMTGKKLLRACAVLSLFPWFFLFSGSVNNDMLSIALSFLTVLAVIKWYKNPEISKLLILALTFGLAAFTKLSAWLIAPAIVFAFVCKIIQLKNKNEIISKGKGEKAVTVPYILVSFAVLSIIAIPLGIGWQIKNLVLYETPINYAPCLSVDSSQYVGNVGVLKRIFGIFSETFSSSFIVWDAGNGSCEYNIFSSLVKTSLFGETAFFELPKTENLYAGIIAVIGRGICTALYIFALLMLVYLVVCAVRFVKNKFYSCNKTALLILFIVFFTFLLNYICSCLLNPFVSTMNFRHAVPCLLLLCVVAGFDKHEEKAENLGERAYSILSGLCVNGFIALSVAVYLLLALE